MAQSWIIAVISLLILLVMGGVLLFFYLRSLQEEINDLWFLLREKLHRRLDKLPALLEIVRRMSSGQEALLKDMIFLRSQSWANSSANRAKVATELNLSAKLHELWEVSQKFPDLPKHSVFLQAKTELKEAGSVIEQELELYNEKVRKFNKAVHFLVFRPLILLFRFQKKTIFEFES